MWNAVLIAAQSEMFGIVELLLSMGADCTGLTKVRGPNHPVRLASHIAEEITCLSGKISRTVLVSWFWLQATAMRPC
jgi:hypothetical protein